MLGFISLEFNPVSHSFCPADMPLPKDIKLDNRELYAHNLNLGKSLIKVRASKYAWGLRNGQKVAADRAATTRSIYYLWNQLEQHGGSGHFTSLIQYDHGDYLKVFYDIDRKFPHPPDVPAIKREIIDVVLTPFFRLMWAKLGHHVDTGNVACVEDIRSQETSTNSPCTSSSTTSSAERRT